MASSAVAALRKLDVVALAVAGGNACWLLRR
jgi:hypothetical protein